MLGETGASSISQYVRIEHELSRRFALRLAARSIQGKPTFGVRVVAYRRRARLAFSRNIHSVPRDGVDAPRRHLRAKVMASNHH